MGAFVEIGDRHLLLFDGVCNLCNGAVNFIIDRDFKQQYVFAPLQSSLGQQIAKQYQLPKSDFNSMVLLKKGKVYLKSNAALEITRDLSGAWPLIYGFKVIPPFLRDWVYGIVSTNRYKWFGRKDQCRIPTVDMKNRFVSI